MIEYLDSVAYALSKDKDKSAIVYTDKCNNRYTLIVNKNNPDEKVITIWFKDVLAKVKYIKCK